MNNGAKKYIDSAKLCLQNAERLLDEAQFLELEEPPATKHYLSVIAQEECAKSFLLYLVSIKLVPWNQLILRAARDHKCKQLLCIVLDFLAPDADIFIKMIIGKKYYDFSSKAVDALHVFRYEKIGRWESNSWVWAEDPDYEKTVLEVSGGRKDQEKQRSLYVELSKTGGVCSTPSGITEKQANDEYESTRRFERFLQFLRTGEMPSGICYEKVENTLKVLFSNYFEESEKN